MFLVEKENESIFSPFLSYRDTEQDAECSQAGTIKLRGDSDCCNNNDNVELSFLLFGTAVLPMMNSSLNASLTYCTLRTEVGSVAGTNSQSGTYKP